MSLDIDIEVQLQALRGKRLTLRQILQVLWARKGIVIAMALIAVVAAGAYLSVRDTSYESSGSVRLNTIVSEGAATEQIGGQNVSIGTLAVTSPEVLDAAASAIGESPDALAGAVKASLVEGPRTSRMVITVQAPSAEGAKARAEAVIEAYRNHVDQQVLATTAALEKGREDAIAQATVLQQEVARDPSNSIAASDLARAISQMNAMIGALEDITRAGPSTTVLTAVPLGTPTVPSIMLVIPLALLTGIIVGIGVALIRDQFDNRLRQDDVIEEITGVPSLGALSWDPSLRRMRPPLPVAGQSRTDLSEGLRALRSTLQVLIPSRAAVVSITSVEPGDGKSFVSSNVALAWARAGKRVILVGGDLRRPDLPRYFGDSADGEGLSDLLRKNESDQELTEDDISSRINPTGYRRLRILPAGAEPHDPADLLAQPELEKVIEHLRTLADIVVIDSPPVFGMADAPLLALRADAAVVVASVKQTDRVRLVDAVASLRASGANVIGVVANRSRRRLPKSYSAYYLQAQRVRPTETGAELDGDGARQSSAHAAIRDAHTNPVIGDKVDTPERKYVLERRAPRRASYSPASASAGVKEVADLASGDSDLPNVLGRGEDELELEFEVDVEAEHTAGDGERVSEGPDVGAAPRGAKAGSAAAEDNATKPAAEREHS